MRMEHCGQSCWQLAEGGSGTQEDTTPGKSGSLQGPLYDRLLWISMAVQEMKKAHSHGDQGHSLRMRRQVYLYCGSCVWTLSQQTHEKAYAV